MKNLSPDGFRFLLSNEGLRLEPYPDSKGIPTIGIGSTRYEDGRAVKLTDPPITKEQAHALFWTTVKQYEACVNRSLKVELTQRQFDALVSMCYNIGVNGFASSTLVKVLNAGQFEKAPAAMMLWTKNPELIGRRKKEVNYFTGR